MRPAPFPVRARHVGNVPPIHPIHLS